MHISGMMIVKHQVSVWLSGVGMARAGWAEYCRVYWTEGYWGTCCVRPVYFAPCTAVFTGPSSVTTRKNVSAGFWILNPELNQTDSEKHSLKASHATWMIQEEWRGMIAMEALGQMDPGTPRPSSSGRSSPSSSSSSPWVSVPPSRPPSTPSRPPWRAPLPPSSGLCSGSFTCLSSCSVRLSVSLLPLLDTPQVLWSASTSPSGASRPSSPRASSLTAGPSSSSACSSGSKTPPCSSSSPTSSGS